MPERGQLWKHAVTGGIYVIDRITQDEETGELRVVYQQFMSPSEPFWDRLMTVFISDNDSGESRFVRIS